MLEELLRDLAIRQRDVVGCLVNVRSQNTDSRTPYIVDAVVVPHFVLHWQLCSTASEFACGFFKNVKSLFHKKSCRLHFHFTNFPSSFAFHLSLALLLDFVLTYIFSVSFRRSALLCSRVSGHFCELICSLLDFLV